MKFKFITPSHAYYRDELMLRWEVLSKPLGLPPGSEITAEEMECIHLLVMEEKKIIGCVLFHQESTDSGRIMQLALSEDCRGKGCGRKLIAHLEQDLSRKGISNLYIYAKEDLEGFYQKLGYHSDGESFDFMEAPHRVMKKVILADSLRSA